MLRAYHDFGAYFVATTHQISFICSRNRIHSDFFFSFSDHDFDACFLATPHHQTSVHCCSQYCILSFFFCILAGWSSYVQLGLCHLDASFIGDFSGSAAS